MVETISTIGAMLDGWIIKPDLGTSFQNLSLTLTLGRTGNLNPIEDSSVFIIDHNDLIVGVGKVFRTRTELYKAHVYFKQVVTPNEKKKLSGFGLKDLESGVLYSRLEWDVFDKTCKSLLGHSSYQIAPIKGDNLNE